MLQYMSLNSFSDRVEFVWKKNVWQNCSGKRGIGEEPVKQNIMDGFTITSLVYFERNKNSFLLVATVHEAALEPHQTGPKSEDSGMSKPRQSLWFMVYFNLQTLQHCCMGELSRFQGTCGDVHT